MCKSDTVFIFLEQEIPCHNALRDNNMNVWNKKIAIGKTKHVLQLNPTYRCSVEESCPVST